MSTYDLIILLNVYHRYQSMLPIEGLLFYWKSGFPPESSIEKHFQLNPLGPIIPDLDVSKMVKKHTTKSKLSIILVFTFATSPFFHPSFSDDKNSEFRDGETFVHNFI